MILNNSNEIFLLSFSKQNEIARVEKLGIPGAITLNNSNYKCNGAIISDIKFLEEFEINNVNIGCGIIFKNCSFNKNLILFKVTSAGLNQEINKDSQSIAFINCKINNLLIKSCEFERDISIIDNSSVSQLEIHDVKLIQGSLRLQNTTIKGNFYCSFLDLTNNIYTYKTLFEGHIRFEQVIASNYDFIKSTFNKDIYLWSGKARHGITINECTSEEDFRIQAVETEVESNLALSDNEFKSSLFIDYFDKSLNKLVKKGCKKIYITTSKFNNGLFIIGSDNSENIPEIDLIHILPTNKLVGQVFIKNFKIIKVELNDLNINAYLNFEDIQISWLEFDSFSNHNVLKFYNLKSYGEDSELRIFKSYLGTTHFYNCALDSFKNISIADSVFLDIITSNVSWFTYEQVMQAKESKGLTAEYFKNKRDLFKQLKHAMEKQGDKVQALIFKAYEMEALKKVLSFEKPRKKGERFMMWLNYHTNKYGQYWLRPIGWAGLVTFISYIIIVLSSTPELSFSLSIKTIDIARTWLVLVNNSGAYFQLLNPAHAQDKLFEGVTHLPFWASFFDFLQRIIISYLIFQTVSAFRKYIKS